MGIDHATSMDVLTAAFIEAETAFQEKNSPPFDPAIENHVNNLLSSNTQAYREVLLGSILVRIQDKGVDLHLPYVQHGANAYHGREFDERIVNPFLQSKRIPSSKGPFLNVFRRAVKFTRATRKGLRDKKGYDSFLSLIQYVGGLQSDDHLRAFLTSLLYKFLELRESSNIEIARVQRLSVPQHADLLESLLGISSGGRFPVFLVLATLRAVKQALGLKWEISHQGINVADSASEQPGDITVSRDGNVFLAAEVTERVVDKARVVSTFTSKIAPAGVEDYIFFVRFRPTGADPDPDALKQAHQYFAQGHDVNFLDVKTWVLNTLSTIGKDGRAAFIVEMVKLLEGNDVPRSMKVGWNEQIQKLTNI